MNIRSSHQWCSMFLKISQDSQENTYARVSFLIKLQAAPATLLKKILTRVFSSEFCEICKSNFFTEHLRTTASTIRSVTFVYSCWIY